MIFWNGHCSHVVDNVLINNCWWILYVGIMYKFWILLSWTCNTAYHVRLSALSNGPISDISSWNNPQNLFHHMLMKLWLWKEIHCFFQPTQAKTVVQLFKRRSYLIFIKIIGTSVQWETYNSRTHALRETLN